MKIEATIVVEFGEGDEAGYLAHVILDEESNGEGKSSFAPDESAVLQAHFSSNVTLLAVVPTDGSLQTLDSVPRENISSNLFTSRDKDEVSKFILPVVPNSVATVSNGRVALMGVETLSGGRE